MPAAGSETISPSDPVASDGPISAAAVPAISTSPPLSPQFQASVSDYVVRCAESGGTVTLTADMPTGTSISVNGGAGQSGAVTASVALRPNEKMTWTIQSGGSSSTHYARCLPVGFPQWTATRTGTPQAQWYVTAPGLAFGPAPAQYVVVADSNGTPVWWMSEPAGAALDAKHFVNPAAGPEIAWVVGGGGYSLTSTYRMYGLDGQLRRSIGNSTLDHHDLQRTTTGSYLSLRYVPRNCPTVPTDCVDESPWGGPTSVNPIDAEVVRFDAAGNQVGTWSTRGRVALSEAASWIASGERSDIVHINSVEPDGAGGFVFSARHLDAVYHVDANGVIDWKLGGTTTPASLTVVGDTSGGPVFSGQHDARILADGTVTVHDNGTLPGRPPRALRFSLNLGARTATVVENVGDARVTGSACCGSARRLSGGNWVAGWGASSIIGELTPAGSPVLTIDTPGVFTYRLHPIEAGVISAAQLRQGMDAMPLGAGLAAPTNGVTLSNAVWFVADTSGPVARTEFHLSGNGLTDRIVGDGVLGIYGWLSLWNSDAVRNGTYSVWVRAFRNSGSYVDSQPVSITVANVASVAISDPPDGAVVTGLRWLAAQTTGFTTGVEFRLTGKRVTDRLICTAALSPYGWLCAWDSTAVPKGTYQMVARAYDGLGGSVNSPPVTISVSQTTKRR